MASEKVDNPELFFGLVGPIGVDLDPVVAYLKKSLKQVGYDSEIIHLTKVMCELYPDIKVDESSYYNKYMSLIKGADHLRGRLKNNAALAGLAITQIRYLRQHNQPEIDPRQARGIPRKGVAYIIRQLKRDEEIKLLREVYGRKFIQVSVFLDEEDRRYQLVRKIKSFGTGSVDSDDALKCAIDLVKIDNNEESDKYGQRITDVFHLGDVFVKGKAGSETDKTITRFIEALFGHNGHSPNKYEYGMYTASGAALRSLDLSRQVGAAIFSDVGEIVTLGCNEVPKAFGGTYWCDDPTEPVRDFEEGADGNHKRKIRVIHDLIARMEKLGIFTPGFMASPSTDDRVRALLSEDLIRESKIMDLIEFGRIIHAEMSAITDAARIGKSVKNALLFCTTFPCHMCAKHIVSAGIRRVIFLEPYPKSHARDLHDDSITFSQSEKDKKVLFEPFIGISPRRYRDIFEKKKRKNGDGVANIWYYGKPTPMIEDRSPAYIENEEPAISLIFGGPAVP